MKFIPCVRLCACAVLLVACASSSLAAGWYAGVEGGSVTHTFKSHYEYTYGGTPDEYTDPAYGVMAGFLGGYQFPLAERFSVSLQGRVSADTAEWTLYTDEPAQLTYRLPFAYSASLLPEIKLMDRIRVFGEIGTGQGYMDLRKESALSSRYEAREWTPAYSFGGGLRYEINESWRAFLQYRHTVYGQISYDSHLPDGTHWEMIDSDATTDFFSAGLTCHFGGGS